MHGQAPWSQDLWHRDMLPRRHESWRRPSGSKDEFTSPMGPNVNFLQKKGKIVKKIGPPRTPTNSVEKLAEQQIRGLKELGFEKVKMVN